MVCGGRRHDEQPLNSCGPGTERVVEGTIAPLCNGGSKKIWRVHALPPRAQGKTRLIAAESCCCVETSIDGLLTQITASLPD